MEEKQLKKYILKIKDQARPKRNNHSVKASEEKSISNLGKTTKKRKEK